MKRLVPVVAVIMLASPLFAGMGIGAFGNVSIPMGDFGDAAGTGFGGGAKFFYGALPNMKMVAEACYTTFGEKEEIEGEDWSFSIIPIVAGIDYNLMPGPMSVYVGVGGGLYMLGVKYDGESDSESKFGIYGGLGMELPIGESMTFDANVKFNHIFTEEEATQYLGINAGINYYFPMPL